MKQQQGFTLVELAIALMVIGLLIGGILKGQELIENTRIARMMRDIENIDTAIMVFHSTYEDLPGDMKDPGRFLPDCTAPHCNQTETNAWYNNGQVDGNSGIERRNFWIHLNRANFLTMEINENETSVYNVGPETPFGARYTFLYRDIADGIPLHRYEVSTYVPDIFPCSRTAALDTKMDDGKPWSGMIQAYHTTTAGQNECVNSANPTVYRSGSGLKGAPFITSKTAN